jgi:hypothetical protein
MPNKFYQRKQTLLRLEKNDITEFCNISLLIVIVCSKSNNAGEKIGVTVLLFQLHKAIVIFVRLKYDVSNY